MFPPGVVDFNHPSVRGHLRHCLRVTAGDDKISAVWDCDDARWYVVNHEGEILFEDFTSKADASDELNVLFDALEALNGAFC